MVMRRVETCSKLATVAVVEKSRRVLCAAAPPRQRRPKNIHISTESEQRYLRMNGGRLPDGDRRLMSMLDSTDKLVLLLATLLTLSWSSSAAQRPQAGERAPPLKPHAPGQPHASVLPDPVTATNTIPLTLRLFDTTTSYQQSYPQQYGHVHPAPAHERIQWTTAPAADMPGSEAAASDTRTDLATSATDTTNSTSNMARFKYPVWWFAPFWSGTGYSSEAINYVLSMVRSGSIHPSDLWVTQHGDNERKVVRASMQPHDSRQLTELEKHVDRTQPAIVVCHSLPTNWMLPSPMGWAGAKCPPDPREYAYVYLIGRTMFETDRLPVSFVARCNAMNEVWVPSNFSKEVFIASGVVPSKLRVVPEGINTTYFDPARYKAMPMPQGELVFGPPPVPAHTSNNPLQPPLHSSAVLASTQVIMTSAAASAGSKITTFQEVGAASNKAATVPLSTAAAMSAASNPGSHQASEAGQHTVPNDDGEDYQDGDRDGKGQGKGTGEGKGDSGAGEDDVAWTEQAGSRVQGQDSKERLFRFLSTFKWEARKGWDVLLEAYLSEFTAQDNVELTIITKPFMGKNNFKQQMHTWAERAARARYHNQWGGTIKLIQELQARLQKEAQEAQAKQGQSANSEMLQQLQTGDGAATIMGHDTQHAQHDPITLQHPQDLSQVLIRSIVDPYMFATDSKQASIQVTSKTGVGTDHSAVPVISQPHQDSSTVHMQNRGPAVSEGRQTHGVSQGQQLAPEATSPNQQLRLPKVPPFVFDPTQLPRLYVVHEHIPDPALPRFYKAVDAFVLPSRGEGWGRPHVEAMAMGLPVISTNWSGITAYLDESVGYPLKVEGLVPADPAVWWFRGLRWAQPSVTHLRQLMRAVYSNRTEAARRGAAARRRMVEQFGPDAIGRLVAEELRRVDALIPR